MKQRPLFDIFIVTVDNLSFNGRHVRNWLDLTINKQLIYLLTINFATTGKQKLSFLSCGEIHRCAYSTVEITVYWPQSSSAKHDMLSQEKNAQFTYFIQKSGLEEFVNLLATCS